MSAISDERARLHSALVAACAGLIEAERVHLYTPPTIASPCCWIAQPRLNVAIVGSPGATMIIATFPVYVVASGYEPAQAALNDELVARVWDAGASMARAEASSAVPQPVDVGGASQRAVVVDVDVTVTARTLCPIEITTRALATNGARNG